MQLDNIIDKNKRLSGKMINSSWCWGIWQWFTYMEVFHGKYIFTGTVKRMKKDVLRQNTCQENIPGSDLIPDRVMKASNCV
jgi:hypothetical protein